MANLKNQVISLPLLFSEQKKRVFFIFLSTLVAVSAIAASAVGNIISDEPLFDRKGVIRGTVINTCVEEDDPDPPDATDAGVLVYVLGVSVTAKTGPDGSFLLLGVPPGAYYVAFEAPGLEDPYLLDVIVESDAVTDLGVIWLCGERCGDHVDCAEDEYCAKQNGYCLGLGTCTSKPAACDDIADPVCGCDGVTYANPCTANAEGVNIAYEGTCRDRWECLANSSCPDGHYCAKNPGNCGGEGECVQKPQFYIEIYHPVCGCDGKTYGNEYEAAANGVNVDYEGQCGSASTDACTSNADCPPDRYCAKGVGDCNGVGACSEIPPGPCNEIVYQPVCGCDGVTYDGVCDASLAGVSVDYYAPCDSQPGGGCDDNGQCPSGTYCSKALGDCSGQGNCVPKPDACIQLYDPVCGCDGITYSNTCSAASAGVAVKYKGRCSDDDGVRRRDL